MTTQNKAIELCSLFSERNNLRAQIEGMKTRLTAVEESIKRLAVQVPQEQFPAEVKAKIAELEAKVP